MVTQAKALVAGAATGVHITTSLNRARPNRTVPRVKAMEKKLVDPIIIIGALYLQVGRLIAVSCSMLANERDAALLLLCFAMHCGISFNGQMQLPAGSNPWSCIQQHFCMHSRRFPAA